MAAPIWRGIMPNILLDVETVEGYKRRIAELEAELRSANNSAFGSETARILGLAKAIEELKRRTGEQWRFIKNLEAELKQCLDCCKRVGELEGERDEADKRIAELEQCCSQRGARMQIMFEYNKTVFHVIPAEWLAWFDYEGVPVNTETKK